MKVVIKKGLVRYYLQLIAKNGEVLAHTEHYFSLSNARRSANSIAKEVKTGKVTVEEQ